MHRFVFAFVVLWFTIPVVAGQVSSDVTGVVVDESGAAIPDTHITLADGSGLTVRTISADRDGRFTISNVPAGTYTLTADRDQFEPATTAVTLPREATAPALRLVLKVRAIREDVVVTAAVPYRAETASTATKTGAPILEVPQTIQVVTQALIADRGAVTVSDVLRNVPGVSAGSSRLQPFPDFTYLVRGQGVRIFRDGIRHRYYEGVDPSALAPIASVEVLKSPASTLYGLGGLGGSINYITKLPETTLHTTGSLLFGEREKSGGTFDITGPLVSTGRVRARVTGEFERSDLFADFSDVKHGNATLSVAADVTPRLHLLFMGEYQRRVQPRFPGLPLYGTVLGLNDIELPVTRNLAGPDIDALDTDGGMWRAGVAYDVTKRWSARLTVQRTSFNGEFDSIALSGILPGNRTVNRTFRHGQENDRDNNAVLDVKGTVETGPISHTLVAGTQLALFRGHFFQFGGGGANGGSLGPIDILSPNYGTLPPGGLVLNFNQPDQQYDNYGVYAQDLIHLRRDLVVLVGLRQDSVDYSATPDGQPKSYHATHTSSQAGLSYLVTPHVSLFTGYATGFDADNLVSTRLAGGDLFAPETSLQVEGGLKLDLTRGLSGTLAFFQNTHQNVLTPDQSNPGFSIQTGETRSRGFDGDVTWRVVPELSVVAGYALVNAVVTADTTTPVGNQVANVPRNSGNLWARYAAREGALRGMALGMGLTVVGDRFGTNANTYRLPGYTTLDATFSYRFKMVQADLFVRNLTDTLFFQYGGSTTVFPGEPRNVYARLVFRP